MCQLSGFTELCCLIKNLAAASPEYVATHSHPTGYLRPCELEKRNTPSTRGNRQSGMDLWALNGFHEIWESLWQSRAAIAPSSAKNMLLACFVDVPDSKIDGLLTMGSGSVDPHLLVSTTPFFRTLSTPAYIQKGNAYLVPHDTYPVPHDIPSAPLHNFWKLSTA